MLWPRGDGYEEYEKVAFAFEVCASAFDVRIVFMSSFSPIPISN